MYMIYNKLLSAWYPTYALKLTSSPQYYDMKKLQLYLKITVVFKRFNDFLFILNV